MAREIQQRQYFGSLNEMQMNELLNKQSSCQ